MRPPGVDDEAVTAACRAAATAAARLRGWSPARRAELLRALADAIDADTEGLVEIADAETALGTTRLAGEVARTSGQLRLLAAEAVRPGTIEPSPVDAGLRRILHPIGPVAVFGASNFPFAFSVLGGDTASALAAGCPVVVKAHPGHPETSARTLAVARQALDAVGAEEGVIGMVAGFEAGRALVCEPRIRAAAFTGSAAAGRALFDLATSRPDPIPFYGELGSVNPVAVTRAAVAARGAQIAAGFVASFTLGRGQFCTKPGVLLLPADHGLDEALAEAVRQTSGGRLLTDEIDDAFAGGTERLLASQAVRLVGEAPGRGQGPQARLYSVSAAAFVAQPLLREECFGPASLLVLYDNDAQLLEALATVPPSLAITIHAEPSDDGLARELLTVASDRCGRVVWNGWPTGVAVNTTMHHGGPWPVTTAPLHTSVGARAIDRFLVPVAYQDVPEELLSGVAT